MYIEWGSKLGHHEGTVVAMYIEWGSKLGHHEGTVVAMYIEWGSKLGHLTTSWQNSCGHVH